MFPHVVLCSEEAASRQQGRHDIPVDRSDEAASRQQGRHDKPVAQRARRRSAERQSKQHAVPDNRLPLQRKRPTPAAGQALDRHEQVSDSGRSSKVTLGPQSPSFSHARSRSTTPTILAESSTSSRPHHARDRHRIALRIWSFHAETRRMQQITCLPSPPRATTSTSLPHHRSLLHLRPLCPQALSSQRLQEVPAHLMLTHVLR